VRTSGFLLLLLLWPSFGYPDTVRYVSDKLEITLRSGKSIKHNILRMLPSGTRVAVLETDPDGYSRVRTASGVEGWLLTRFLSSTPSATERIAQAEQRVAALQIENHQLKAQISLLTQQKNDLDKQRQHAVEETRRSSQRLTSIRETAANALTIEAENRALKEQVLNTERDLQSVQQENAKLRDRTARDWFLVGAGVLLLGTLIGVLVPHLHWRRRSGWDTL
jgi:SH3 domain protein